MPIRPLSVCGLCLHLTVVAVTAAVAVPALTPPAMAEGNLASRPVDLDDLVLDSAALTFSQTEYQLTTGQFYRLRITADGDEEFALLFPELVRNAWIDQVVVGDLEVKAHGLYSLEFDGEGTFVITFIPIRPGRFEFWVNGYRDRGMLGAFVVN